MEYDIPCILRDQYRISLSGHQVGPMPVCKVELDDAFGVAIVIVVRIDQVVIDRAKNSGIAISDRCGMICQYVSPYEGRIARLLPGRWRKIRDPGGISFYQARFIVAFITHIIEPAALRRD
jgi:hypothetical protein